MTLDIFILFTVATVLFVARELSSYYYHKSIDKSKAKRDKDIKFTTHVYAGSYCKCHACDHVGYAYGTPTSSGVSAGYCFSCGKNDKLEVLVKE